MNLEELKKSFSIKKNLYLIKEGIQEAEIQVIDPPRIAICINK